jgi:hypothetical protein
VLKLKDYNTMDEILEPAIRQFRHNGGSEDFVFAYDK